MWGFRGVPGILRASYVTYAGALATLAFGWVRLRGGQPALTIAARLADPRPERWGCRSTADVLSVLRTTEAGLTSAEAAKRKPPWVQTVRRRTFLDEIVGQLRSPVTALLAAGAGLSFTLGAFADVAMIGMVIFGNAAIGAWQERKAGEVTEALERIGAATARVLRAGNVGLVPADDVVPGDVLLLAPGDRVAADARLLEAHGLEVDEAALTGESLPVAKQPDGDTDWSRVVLEGSGVTVGTGRAVVVAVGQHTRLGATAAALALDETQQSPLGVRLSQMLHQMLPVIALGGAVAIAAGMFWQGDWATSLAVGASIAITAIPEGLPLLAGIGEAGVARRLAGRRALVRRLAAVEALGRVDVACTDKTGTLTQGRLTLSLVSDTQQEHGPSSGLPPVLCHVLLTAALASPHPNALDAGAHPTDVAIVQGATDAGLRPALDTEHAAESRFDSARPFHAALVDGRLCVKGAAEALVPRCTWLRSGGASRPLDERGQQELLATAEQLAQRGLRVLMVAEGAPDTLPDDPQELVALGFVGLSDPLRPGVQAAVGRCREAGVRVVMLTGDHPATARVIAEQVGLLGPDDEVITGAEIAELHNGELDERLEHAAVIARITPLDKLRIVESLQRRGHTVAMTGDGVNDAPALRLADVGVAMGQGGTEVARHAADVVLVDDDFATLVDMFVEGRGFWRNMRRALGLLVGSNLGELGFMVGALALGAVAPLTSRQILAVNLVNDGPALAVVLQQPEHRNLSSLAREGTAALGRPLRNDILRRATATAVPALSGYLLALRFGGAAQARSVAFGTIVATQLAQTLDLGRSGAGFTGSVLGAVAGSAGLLVTALTLPLVRDFLVLATPDVLGWTLIGSAALVAVPLARVLATAHGRGTGC
jgi:calcium-translocating P-type ATPase